MALLSPLEHAKKSNKCMRPFWIGGAYENGHDLPDCPALSASEIDHALDALRSMTAAPSASLCRRLGVD